MDKNGNFVRMRTDTLSRVLSEHLIVPDAFAEIEARHLRNPQRFGTPYPFPSIAVDDPAFDHSMRKNSWGGPSQALTALRASRWLEHYRRPGLLMHLLSRWLDALVAADIFGQQINPWTGEFTATTGEYSPSMLLLIEAVARLHGIHRHDGGLAFNCRLPPVATSVECSLSTDKGIAHLKNTDGHTEIFLDGRGVCIIDGVCRLETTLDGRPRRIVGTDPNPTSVGVRIEDARHECSLLENQAIAI